MSRSSAAWICSQILMMLILFNHNLPFVRTLKPPVRRARRNLIAAHIMVRAFKSVRKVAATVPLIASSAVPFRAQRISAARRYPASPIVTTESNDVDSQSSQRFPMFRNPTDMLKKANRPGLRKGSSGVAGSGAMQSQFGSQFVRNAVNTVGPSVVRIDCEREISQLMSLFSDSFKEGDVVKVSGTGIVASSEGLILTNAHVVDQAKKLTITLSNGRSCKAQVVAFDEFTDLAVIRADVGRGSDFNMLEAPLGDSSQLHAGDWVIAVGCPVGLDFTVTLGVVSSPKRSALEVGAPHLKGSYIQTDAALNSGNSGGPLVNDAGQVIGINTMVRTNTEAIGFAIPINRARQIFEVLKTGKKPTHAYFGVEIMSVTPDNARIHNDDPNAHRLPEVHGALVMKVVPGSPADKAGLRKNDIIVAVNEFPIRSSDDAESRLDVCIPGRASTIKVARGEGAAKVDLQAAPQDLYQLIQERKKQQQPVVVLKPSDFQDAR